MIQKGWMARSHPYPHLTLTDQQTNHFSLSIFQTLLIIQDSWVTVDVPSLKTPHQIGFLFISPVSLWFNDQIANHHTLIGGIEDSCLELCHRNIQTRRWFNINETTILLLGCDTIISCNMVGHVEEHNLLSLGVSLILLVVFNKLLRLQCKSVMFAD